MCKNIPVLTNDGKGLEEKEEFLLILPLKSCIWEEAALKAALAQWETPAPSATRG